MIAIRIPKKEHARAWRAMIDVGPIRLVAKDPIYEVSPAHLELLTAQGIAYEVLSLPLNGETRRRGTSH